MEALAPALEACELTTDDSMLSLSILTPAVLLLDSLVKTVKSGEEAAKAVHLRGTLERLEQLQHNTTGLVHRQVPTKSVFLVL